MDSVGWPFVGFDTLVLVLMAAVDILLLGFFYMCGLLSYFYSYYLVSCCRVISVVTVDMAMYKICFQSCANGSLMNVPAEPTEETDADYVSLAACTGPDL